MSATLQSLPTELLLSICAWTFTGHIALIRTCRSLRARLPRRPAAPATMADLAALERWPCYRTDTAFDHPERRDVLKRVWPLADYFGCARCLRLRPALRFANAMLRGGRRKPAPGAPPRPPSLPPVWRLCLDCWVARGAAPLPQKTFYGGNARLAGFVCVRCARFRPCDGAEVRGWDAWTCGACCAGKNHDFFGDELQLLRQRWVGVPWDEIPPGIAEAIGRLEDDAPDIRVDAGATT